MLLPLLLLLFSIYFSLIFWPIREKKPRYHYFQATPERLFIFITSYAIAITAFIYIYFSLTFGTFEKKNVDIIIFSVITREIEQCSWPLFKCRLQRSIREPHKHLWWSFFCKNALLVAAAFKLILAHWETRKKNICTSERDNILLFWFACFWEHPNVSLGKIGQE